jgi:hypothetical protein
MIPLSACADTLGACQEQHTEGNDDDKYAKGDNNNEHLDDNNDNEYSEGRWRLITADAEATQWEVTQDGRQQQSQWTVATRLRWMAAAAMGNGSSSNGQQQQRNGQQDSGAIVMGDEMAAV